MAKRSYGSTRWIISATLARSRSSSSVCAVTAETSSRKSSSSDLSRKRIGAFRVACIVKFPARGWRGGVWVNSGSGGLDNLDAGAGPDAGGAGGGHGAKIVQRAYAAGCLDAHFGSDRGAHQSDIVGGGAAGAKAG